MDKAEYQLKLAELTNCVEAQDYERAMTVADLVDWRRVKSLRTLNMVADVYEVNHNYEKCREILQLALNRSTVGKNILYRLTDMNLRTDNIDEAISCYQKYAQLAGNDNNRFILQYKIEKARRSPLAQQISILEEYRAHEFTERWAYELAFLYHKAGNGERCVEVCDDLILWFSEGRFVVKALELKQQYQPLLPSQEKLYAELQGRYQREDKKREAQKKAHQDLLAGEDSDPSESQNFVQRMDQAGASALRGVYGQDSRESRTLDERVDRMPLNSKEFLGKTVDLSAQLQSSIATVFPDGEPGAVKEEKEEEKQEEFSAAYSEKEAADYAAAMRAAAEKKREQEAALAEAAVPKEQAEEAGVAGEDEAAAREAVESETAEAAPAGEAKQEMDLESLFAETAGSFSEEIAAGGFEEAGEPAPVQAAVAPSLEEGVTREVSREAMQAAEAYAQKAETESTEDQAEEAPAILIEEVEEEMIPSSEKTAAAPVEEAEEVPEIESPSEESTETVASAGISVDEQPEAEETAAQVPEDVTEAAAPAGISIDELPEVEEASEEQPETGSAPEAGVEEIAEQISEEITAAMADISTDELSEAEEVPAVETEESASDAEAKEAAATEESAPAEQTDEAILSADAALEAALSAMMAAEVPAAAQADQTEAAPEDSLRAEAGEEVLQEALKAEAVEEIPAEGLRAEAGEEIPAEGLRAEAEAEIPAEGLKAAAAEKAPVAKEAGQEIAAAKSLQENAEEASDFDEDTAADEDIETKIASVEEVLAGLEAAEAETNTEAKEQEAAAPEETPAAKPLYNEELEIPDPEPAENLSNTHTIDLSQILTNTVSLDQVLEDETPEERRIRILNHSRPTRMSDDQRKIYTYFARIPGMDRQILQAITNVYTYAGERTSARGNIAVMGAKGTGKTRLTHGLILNMCNDFGMEAAKIARVEGYEMNQKDPAQVVAKMAGGFLIIENAGEMNDDVVENLSKAMEFRTDCMILILEDEKASMRAMMKNHPEFAERFGDIISIPVFTNDELVTFARTYADENGCTMDDMGILALYTKIGDNQSEDEPVTIGRVKEMMDSAMDRARRGIRHTKKKAKKGGPKIVLQEKDFAE